jgi:signal transduction histidine kinase/CheY-like chemotaxis protein
LRIKFYTPRAQELFNITSADIARPLEHFTHKLDYGSLTKDAEEVLRSFQLIEREVRTNDDSWYLARLTPYRTLENKIDGVALSFVDITTRVRNEEQLHRQAAQLREQAAALREGDRNKDQFLAMLAHELRNPLGAMLNSIDLLDHLGSSDDASARARGVIQRQGHHLMRLVDDLLDIERLRRGKIVLHKTRVELRAVVCAALEACGPEIAANTHELNLSLPPDPIFLDGDLTRLAQVLTNLLNNALKYTPAGGRIDLIAECAGSEVVIHLRDTGIGMEPAILPHLFEMYAQGDPLSGPAQKGLGVGLALVQQLVQMHCGTVEAASEGTGKGSEFIVRLPITAGPAAQQNTEMTPVREDGALSSDPPKKKVMILDDNRDAADALALLLQTEGHEVRAVYNAQAALETASQFQPEVAILDIGMPDMNGFEVAARVRESLPPIVLIALSGWALGRNDSRIRTAGFDSCFTKPVGAGKLNKLFEEVSKRGGIMTPSRVS